MKQKGFTLIELLMVIAIISLIASIVLASLSDARARGRDATRIKQMFEIRAAIELYYSDHGQYPSMLRPDGSTPIDEDIGIPAGTPWSCVNPQPPETVNWTCYWTESQEDYFLWQLWKTDEIGGGGYIGAKPVDPFWDNPTEQYSYQYEYRVFPAGSNGCPVERGDYYVFAISDLESVEWPAIHPSSPGFSCGSYDADASFQWAAGNFEK